jgi:hypothetical protein
MSRLGFTQRRFPRRREVTDVSLFKHRPPADSPANDPARYASLATAVHKATHASMADPALAIREGLESFAPAAYALLGFRRRIDGLPWLWRRECLEALRDFFASPTQAQAQKSRVWVSVFTPEGLDHYESAVLLLIGTAFYVAAGELDSAKSTASLATDQAAAWLGRFGDH